MPMGVISDADLATELARNGVPDSQELNYIPPPVAPGLRVMGSGNHGNQGRSNGDNNVPEVLRTIIADEATENGRKSAVALAQSFGISPSSVSAYTAGQTSTNGGSNKGNTPLRKSIELTKERLAKKAAVRLGDALNQITPDKLQEASLKTISAVAKDMAVVIKQMEPSADSTNQPTGPQVQVVLFSPPVMKEQDFPCITVKE